VHNPLFSVGRFIGQKYQNARNAIEHCAPSGPQKRKTKESGGFHNHSSLLTLVLGYKPVVKVIFFVPKANFYLVSPQSVRDSYVIIFSSFFFFVLDSSS